MTETSSQRRRERRRIQTADQIGRYSPGIARAEEAALEEYRRHDLEFDSRDKGIWQTGYSLLEHSFVLSQVVERMARARGRTEQLVQVGRVAALLHDSGKLDQECHLYRKVDPLTTEERSAVRKHEKFSGEYVWSLRAFMRQIDHPFLDQVAEIASRVHEPWEIPLPTLREIGFDVKLADMWVGMMENRHRPGLSQFQALDWLRREVVAGGAGLGEHGFREETLTSLATLVNLFGILGLDIPERPRNSSYELGEYEGPDV